MFAARFGVIIIDSRMGSHSALLRQVSSDARAIERENMAWMKPFAQVLRAGAMLRSGSQEAAGHMLSDAAREYEAHDMAAYAVAARDRAARLTHAAPAAAELAAVASFLKEQDVVAPERLIGLLVPGLVA